MQLYDFQKQYISGLPSKYIYSAETGTGKTFMALAHYDKIAYPKPLLIICPASKISTRDWLKAVDTWFEGRERPPVWYYSYEKFSRTPSVAQYRKTGDTGVWREWMEKYPTGQYAVIADECLTGETLIQSYTGLIEIADLKVGDKVLSRNDNNGVLEYKRVTKVIKRPMDKKMYLIKYSDGAIISTHNHPHFVNGQYVETNNIKKGDKLYVANRAYSKPNNKIWGTASLSSVRKDIVNPRIDQISSQSVIKQGVYVLQSNLRESDRKQVSQSTSQYKTKQSDISRESSTNPKEERNIFTNLGTQSLTPTLERWERAYFGAARNSMQQARHPGYWLDNGVAHQNFESQRQWLPTGVQARYRERLIAYWNRSGRREPQGSQPTQGQEKASPLRTVRVESITVLKQTDIRKLGIVRDPDNVYCLEVEDNHNFFANGILTHNCHRMANPQSGIGRTLFRVAQKADFFLGLSATPLPNGWISAANYFKIWGWTPNITAFKKRYCNFQTYKGFPEIVNYWHEGELQKLWNGISKPLRKDEALDLPDLITVPVPLVAGPQYTQVLKSRMFEDTFLDNPSAFLHALRQSVLPPKVTWLDEFLEETSDNVVVFYNYRKERDAIVKLLKQKKYMDRKVFLQDGENHQVPPKEVWDSLHRSITLAQYQSGSVGIEMTYATATVYFSPTYSYVNYEQSIGRTYRNGQTHKVTVYLLCAPATVERAIWAALKNKKDFDHKMWIKENNIQFKEGE